MHCVVTAGPTFEPLDNVRRLTNFSTGRLGSKLAEYLAAQGFKVTLLLGEQAACTLRPGLQTILRFSTTADLAHRLGKLSEAQVDAVFHAAAVSDFRFGKVWTRGADGQVTEISSGKYSTRQGTLLAELIPTEKIISSLRDWFPRARLVGWKFEVEGDREGAIRTAREQITECRTDACVANGRAYGPGFGLVQADKTCLHLLDEAALFPALAKLVA
jgi:phosphopantothenoylcysteine synthetase/decarboxylase